MYDAFWLLPNHLGIAMIFYLGVIRPIEIKVLDMLQIPTETQQTHIFVYLTPRHHPATYVLLPKAISRILQDNVPELALEPRAYRILMQSIFDTHFERTLSVDMVTKVLHAASNSQGQHTEQVHDAHYAQDDIAKGTGLTISNRNSQFAISGAFHLWYGFIDGYNYDSMANTIPNAEMQERKILALSAARNLVLEKYEIYNGTATKRAAHVAHLMSSMPFLFGENSVGLLQYVVFWY